MVGRPGAMKLDSWEEGRKGETIVRDYLANNGHRFFQADLMVNDSNGWYVAEVKNQEMFESPPFDGHGLPRRQIEDRLKFQEDTGIRAMLYIVEKNTNVIYWQFMDKLYVGESFETKGKKPRMIFPLKNFHKIGN